VITLEFDSFYIVSVYIPNAGQGLTRLKYRTEEWDIDFKDFLENLRKKKNVILCGDLNVAHEEIDLKNPKGNKKTAGFTVEERKGFSNLLECGWIDTFRDLYPDKV
jgi:AP endonuclease-1